MKNYFLVATLTFFSFGANAQELSFDETVKYIQAKLDDFGDNRNSTFNAKKNGDIEIWNTKFNLFDLKNNDGKSDEFGFFKLDMPDYAKEIHFRDNGKVITGLFFKTSMASVDLERVYKALRHLRGLCTKEKDPFDN